MPIKLRFKSRTITVLMPVGQGKILFRLYSPADIPILKLNQFRIRNVLVDLSAGSFTINIFTFGCKPMKKINIAAAAGLFFLLFSLFPGQTPGALRYGELRIGAHGSLVYPKNSDFSWENGYGGTVKFKFTDTLGIEAGVDYFRWEFEGDIEMPYAQAPGPITYKEVDRVYPIYVMAMIFSPVVEENARGYLGLGAGYYEIDADINGSYQVTDPDDSDNSYPVTITGDINGQWSVHAAVGADFQLSDHIFLNVEARYVLTDVDREQTHSTPDGTAVTVEDSPDFTNFQVRAGLEYSF